MIGWIILFIILAFVALLIFGIIELVKFFKRETFKVMGSLGPYKQDYATCLRNCQADDPTHYMSNDKLQCGQYCDWLFSELDRSQVDRIPHKLCNGDTVTNMSYKRDLSTDKLISTHAPQRLYNDQVACQELCGSDLNCSRACVCHNEVAKFCAENCKYSSLPHDQCMEYCAKSKSINCVTSGGWQFRM